MKTLWNSLRSSWTRVLGAITRRRSVVLAILTTGASAAVGAFFESDYQRVSGIVFLVLVFLIVLTGSVPSRYAAAQLLSSMLPAIHRILQLGDSERLTIHHLRSVRREKYEQLTDYEPKDDRVTRGRVFTFSHGITGQVFKTREPLCWSILDEVEEDELRREPDQSWRRAMKKRWSFDDSELSRVTPRRHSFLAYPIGQEGSHSRAVLFIDSSDPRRFFQDRTKQDLEMIRATVLPILKEALRSV